MMANEYSISLGVMKIFWNYIILMVAQSYECLKKLTELLWSELYLKIRRTFRGQVLKLN